MSSDVHHETVSAPPGSAESPPRLRHRILQAGGWAGAGFALDKILAAGQLMVLARLLAPDDFGLMAASAAVLMAVQTFSELGLEPAVIAKQDVTEEDMRVAWTLSLLRGLLLSALVWGAADAIAAVMHIAGLGVFLRIHTLGVLLQSLQSPALFMLLKRLDLRRRVSFDLSRRLVEVVVTIGLALWWQSAWALLGGQMAAFLFGVGLSYRLAPCRVQWSLDRKTLSGLWRYGRYQNATAWFLFIVMNGGDLLVGRLLGVSALGHYQVALAIPMMIGVRAMGVIAQISLPTYALLQRDEPGARRALSLQMSLTAMVVVPAAVVVAILAPYLVPVLFGPSWAAIVEPLRVLTLFAVAAAFCSVMTAFHCGAGHPRLQTKIWAAMAACYLGSAIPMTLAWGLIGASWGLVLTFVLGLGLNVRATIGLLGAESWPAFDPLRWAAAVVALVAMGLMLGPLMPAGWVAQVVLPLCGGVGIALYGWHLWTTEYGRLRALWEA